MVAADRSWGRLVVFFFFSFLSCCRLTILLLAQINPTFWSTWFCNSTVSMHVRAFLPFTVWPAMGSLFVKTRWLFHNEDCKGPPTCLIWSWRFAEVKIDSHTNRHSIIWLNKSDGVWEWKCWLYESLLCILLYLYDCCSVKCINLDVTVQ